MFTSTGGTEAVSLSGTPDRALTEMTICLWMKTNQSSDTNGTPLSYTANGRKNEIAINDYKNFNLKIGRRNVGYAAIFFSFFHSTFFNCIQTKKGPKLEKIRNNLSHQPEKKQPTVHDATSYKCHFSTLSLERFFSYFLTSTL